MRASSSVGGTHCRVGGRPLLSGGHFIARDFWKGFQTVWFFLPAQSMAGPLLVQDWGYMWQSSFAPVCSSYSRWAWGLVLGTQRSRFRLGLFFEHIWMLDVGTWTLHPLLAVWGVKQFATHSCRFQPPSMLHCNVWLLENVQVCTWQTSTTLMMAFPTCCLFWDFHGCRNYFQVILLMSVAFYPFCFFLVQFYLVRQERGVSTSYSSGAGSTLPRLMIFCSLIPWAGSRLTAVFSCCAEQWEMK